MGYETKNAIAFLENLHTAYWSRLGTVFETEDNQYFYDTGTGKVFACDPAEYAVLACLLNTSDPAEITGLELEERALTKALDTILLLVEQEKILQAPEFKSFVIPEKAELPGIIQGGIEQIIIELTEKCNLRCKYCLYQEDNVDTRNFSKQDMDWEVARKALDYISHNVGKELALTFYGGEPLVNFKLMKQCIEYSKSVMPGVNIPVSFTTNLTLVTDEIAAYLATLDQCSVLCSLDGPEHVHDYFRVTVGGKGSFHQALRGLKRLVKAFEGKARHKLGINAVLCPPYSKPRFDEVNDFFKTLEWLPKDTKIDCSYVDTGTLDWSKLGHVKTTLGDGEFYSDDERTDPLGKWAEYTLDSDQDERGLAKELSQNKLLRIHNRVITDEPLLGIRMNGCCIPGRRRLYVTTDGKFKVCEKMANSPYIGDVEAGIDIDALNKYYFEEYTEKSIKHCSNCWAARLCSICYAPCYQENGLDEEKKQSQCYGERASMKMSLKRYHQLIEKSPEKLEYFNELTVS
ncbi:MULTISPECIES: radical SAM protein [Paenibacillus]|jgi:uncharacterized protein|uniref:radical SAM protein n=1 Tax=Paenibacillus TaxID=44249 RepID=UPI0005A6F75E|nr:radical SAM protein [Paenibacillus sp. FSL P4-0081]OMF22437.1 hypothetical protein BK132_29565 [Paenibacillus sp. FSL H8-0259]